MSVPVLGARNGYPGVQCSAKGCADPIKARGLCNKHYVWLMRYGDVNHQPPRGGPKFSPAALEKAGVTKAQRNYWAKTGRVDAPLDPATGRRSWTASEVRVAILIARLTGAGVELDAAVTIARAVVEHATHIHDLGNGVSLVVWESTEDRAVTAW